MYLSWEQPDTQERVTISHYCYFYQWREIDRQQWLKTHYQWEVSCHCQSDEKLRMNMSRTKQDQTYYLRNSKDTIHHPQCPFSQTSVRREQRMQTKVEGLWKGEGMTPISNELASYLWMIGEPCESTTFEWFARRWIERTSEAMIEEAFRKKWDIPTATALYRQASYILEREFQDETTQSSLTPLYVTEYRWSHLSARAQQLYDQQYPLNTLVFTMGEIVEVGAVKKIKQKPYRRLTIKTQRTKDLRMLSDVWCPLEQWENQWAQIGSSWEKVKTQKGQIWFVGGSPLEMLLNPKGVEWETHHETKRPIPFLTEFNCFLMTTSGIPVKHFHELHCFQQAFEQQIWVKKPFKMTDKMGNWKSDFYYFSSEQQRWIGGDIWSPSFRLDKSSYRCLKQEKRQQNQAEWKWTPFYQSQCPPMK